MKILRIFCVLGLILTLCGCAVVFGKPQPPIIVTGPTGITPNGDSYKVVRVKNVGPGYKQFWLGNGQQIVLYPGTQIFLKPTNDLWNKCQGFWIHTYLQVDETGRVKSTTFTGEEWAQVCITGYTWVCDTGQVVGADIVLGGIPQSYYPFPTHFSVAVPFFPISIQGGIQ
ncbi:MAG: hypothetical protein WC461_02905 [Candidatus Paceibacterota bacterium]